MLIIIFLILCALLFDFLNGRSDAANAIATVVSTHVLTPRLAVLWAAFFNFSAAFVFGLAVASTIGKGIIDINIVDQKVVFAALFGAIIWTYLCISYGMPISVSHALIGGLVGAALIKGGTTTLIWAGLVKILFFIFLAPLMGMTISFILMIAVMWIFRFWTNRKVDRVFRTGQLLSSACYSLGHGTNDAQKTMGIIALLLFSSAVDLPSWIYDKSQGFHIPWWVVIAAHSAIALGTLTGGWKVIRTLGVKLTHLRPIGGFCAETGGSIVLLGTALFGIPVSTTHTIAGAIMGVGATRRISAVRWGIVGNIVTAWILTIPASATMSAVVYYLTKLLIS